MVNTRANLAKYFSELGFNIGAEIGVAQGDYAQVLCETISNLKYYGIDPWYVGGMKNHVHRGQYELTQKKLAPFDATLIKKYSLKAVKNFADSSLDFVYIDANHQFDYVVCDIIEWTKKVKKGGIVSGHDYVVANTCGVIEAVDGYIHAHSLHLNLTTDPAEKISWWFVKRWNT
mgnify:CR=1 FL=1